MIELHFIGTDATSTLSRSFDNTEEILIGRDQSWAQFVTPPTEKLVSRRHARLYRDASGAWRVERQGDRFIAVNGVPVEQSSVLKSGDTLTLGKIREIAVLKLIGTKNRTIAGMIVQQALGLGVIGFVVGKISATLMAPAFPKYVLLVPQDTAMGLAAILAICVLASGVAIRAALKVDPAEAVGG